MENFEEKNVYFYLFNLFFYEIIPIIKLSVNQNTNKKLSSGSHIHYIVGITNT